MPREEELKVANKGSVAPKAEKAVNPFEKYDIAVEYGYYDDALRKAHRNKNPEKYDALMQEFANIRKKSESERNRWTVQKSIPADYVDFLSDDEIKQELLKLKPVNGQDPYARFMELRKLPYLGGYDYGFAERKDFSGYKPSDLAIEKVASFYDGPYYYKPKIVDGKLVRDTNMGLSGALKQLVAKK